MNFHQQILSVTLYLLILDLLSVVLKEFPSRKLGVDCKISKDLRTSHFSACLIIKVGSVSHIRPVDSMNLSVAYTSLGCTGTADRAAVSVGI